MSRTKIIYTGVAVMILISAALWAIMPALTGPQRKAQENATEAMFKIASGEALRLYKHFNSGMPFQVHSAGGPLPGCIERKEPEAESTCEKVFKMKSVGSYDDLHSVLAYIVESLNAKHTDTNKNPYNSKLPAYAAGPGFIDRDKPGTVELSVAPDSAIVVRAFLKSGDIVRLLEVRVKPYLDQ